MQKNSATFLWLILIGTVTIIEAAPDGSPMPARHIDAEQRSTASSFLERAHAAGAILGNGAAALLQGAQTRAGTIRRKSISPEKPRRGHKHASTETKKGSSSVFSDSIASIIPTGSPEELGNSPLDKPTASLPTNHPYSLLRNLDRPPSPNNRPNEIQNAQLRDALTHKDIEVAIQLVQAGANPNEQEEIHGNTLLHFAAGRGDLSTLKWLIEEKGARADTQNAFNRTPLDLAILLEKPRTTQCLQAMIPSSSTPHDGLSQNGASSANVSSVDRYNAVIAAMQAQQRPSQQLCAAPDGEDDDKPIYADLSQFVVYP